MDPDTDHHPSFMDHLLQELCGQRVFCLSLRCDRVGTNSMKDIRQRTTPMLNFAVRRALICAAATAWLLGAAAPFAVADTQAEDSD